MVSSRPLNDPVSVIIVTWNAGEFLEQCLAAVFCQTGAACEVIVVDNNSQDSTPRILDAYAGRIVRIRNSENRGFCAANNQGISRATGSMVLTLNSDVVLAPTYVSELCAFLHAHPDAAMVQGKLLRMDGRTIDSAGLVLSAAKRLFDRGGGQADAVCFNEPCEIFGPCAAAAMYRRDVLEEIHDDCGYFDERFFFLAEDFDLAWRIRKRGWQAWYVPQAKAYHHRHSASHNAPFKQYLSWRNRYYLLCKHARLKDIIGLVPVFCWYDLPRFVYFVFKNPYARRAVAEVNDCLFRRGAWRKERRHA